jgi:hypothetical protein
MLNYRSGCPERQGALPLSYGRMERPAGFEPATTRLAAEVSDIFTTESSYQRSAISNQQSAISNQQRSVSSWCLLLF